MTTLAGAPGDGVWVESTGSWEFEVAAKKEVQKEEQMTQKAEDDEERRVIKEQWSEFKRNILLLKCTILLCSAK